MASFAAAGMVSHGHGSSVGKRRSTTLFNSVAFRTMLTPFAWSGTICFLHRAWCRLIIVSPLFRPDLLWGALFKKHNASQAA